LTRFTAAQHDAIAERIGYRFTNRSLLAEALTHRSSPRPKRNYQRLEFLGDRVLGLIIAEQLYAADPGHSEGELTARLSALVRGEACATAGDTIGLSELVVIGADERSKGMHLNRGVLGDAMEALIAAIYLDGGLEQARAFVLRCWKELLRQPLVGVKDPKTFLQEWALARAMAIPSYTVVSREGPEHEPVFAVAVQVQGMAPAQGAAKSKRAAEMAAAEAFLSREGIR
jgi:ribonuclease-3